jgi:hypothetical protein
MVETSSDSIKGIDYSIFLPTHRIREAAHPTLREFLHNHRKVERRWVTSDIDPLPCCCEELRKMITCSTPFIYNTYNTYITSGT